MIRSFLFNALYYGLVPIIGVLILPSLLLPDRLYQPFIRGYFAFVHRLEKYVLGLDYVVEGEQYIHSDSPYIVAAKHQSAYETLKLPLLFRHPVVILKRELLSIPFWGWYAARAGHIGIDRSQPRLAMEQMLTGVKTAAGLGRTVVIFPQGTRVPVQEHTPKKPYKRGVFEIYRTLNLPVVPMALNTGLFWPRNAFLKRPGTVTFKFLPPIPPGLDEPAFMQRLEQALETESALLAERAQASLRPARKSNLWGNIGLSILTLLILGYTGFWFFIADLMQKSINQGWADIEKQGVTLSAPPARVTGFPGRFHIVWRGTVKAKDLQMRLSAVDVSFWPIPLTPLRIDLKDLDLVGLARTNLIPELSMGHDSPTISTLKIESLHAAFEIPAFVPTIWTKAEVQKLHDYKVTYRLLDFAVKNFGTDDLMLQSLSGYGFLFYDEDLQPEGTLDLVFSDPETLRDSILARLIHHPMGRSFVTGAINTLLRDDPQTGKKILPLTFTLKNGSVYAGPLKMAYVGHFYWPVVSDPPGTPAAPAPARTSPLTR